MQVAGESARSGIRPKRKLGDTARWMCADSGKRPRLQWTKEQRRKLIIALFQQGIRASSPKALLQVMRGAGGAISIDNLTTEHLKSHLQKVIARSSSSTCCC